MKKNVILTTLLLLVGTFCLTTVWAQSPEKMSYQAVIRDASDDLITDTQVGMQISILQGSAGGTAVYVETQTPTTNANGLVSIEIGAGTVESGDFTAIDWTAGPYFIKTETDPAGGTSYSITGTSQLLSVPYALHAKHADAVAISGDETAFDGWDKDSSDDFDGEYNSLNGTPTNVSTFTNDAGYLTTIPNQAIGIEYTSSSYGLWVISASPEFRGRLYDSNDNPLSGILSMSFGLYDNETSGTQVWSEVIDLAFTDGFFSGTLGTNTPFSDVFETYPELFLEITVGGETLTPRFQIEQAGKAFYADKAGEIDYANVNNTPDLSGFISTETDPSVPVGTQTGEMQYWNGSVWITVPAGTQGNILTFVNNAPMWRPVIEDKDVLNPATGKVWMDKNLGASQVADSSNDYNAYGALFQWGRLSDGHECITWTNSTTGTPDNGTTSTNSSSDDPGHSLFITEESLPYDWRSPQNDNLWQGVSGTNNPCPSGYRLPTETELNNERASWSSDDAAGAYGSPLKLPVAGDRAYSDGSLVNTGSIGYYWSSSVDGAVARILYFFSSNAGMDSHCRANGISVRCIKD